MENRVSQFFLVLQEFNFKIHPQIKILDLGCGNGDMVDSLRKMGYVNAFGCDIQFKDGLQTLSLEKRGIISKISFDPYKLPFENNYFDIIISDQVFEHVKDYNSTISEINRVLNSEGVCLNFFPSRYRIIEPHVKIPLATIIRSRFWLSFWAFVGIRKKSQKGMCYREVSNANWKYLNTKTTYLKKHEIRNYFNKHFQQTIFAEGQFIKHNRSSKLLHRLCLYFPIIASLYSTFKGRVVLARTKRIKS